MNYKRAYVNGGRSVEVTDPARLDNLALLVPQMRPVAEAEMDNHPDENFYKGYRWNDDKAVAYRAYGHMPEEAFSDQSLMEEYVVAALLDSASADHWYTFEKEWE